MVEPKVKMFMWDPSGNVHDRATVAPKMSGTVAMQSARKGIPRTTNFVYALISRLVSNSAWQEVHVRQASSIKGGRGR